MKLYELVGVKKFADLDYREVLDSMLDYKNAGSGANAIVFKHGTRNEVIKFWLEDAAYEEFIDYVIKHPSKYFPKLYSKPKELTAFFLRPKDFPKKVKYVRMESLEQFDEPFDGFLNGLSSIFVLARKHDVKDFKEFMEHYGFHEKFDEAFVEAMYDLSSSLSNEHFVDIHAGNIMMRGSTPVIIDPVANSKSMGLTELIIKKMKNAKDLPKNLIVTGRSK